MTNRASRRQFLAHASVGVAAVSAFGKGSASAASLRPRLVVGLIGCGGRGVHDAGLFQKTDGVELAYVCDVDEQRRRAAVQRLGLKSEQAVADLRRILDDPAVSAVIVATPDHWHAPASILACDAGKHVYVEKPISHNIRESRLLVEAAKRNHVLVQHGTQSRSTQMMIDAVRMLQDGVIGRVLVAKCWNIQRRESIGRGEFTDPPAELDYDNWVGPAPMIPYRTNRVHNRWTPWYHFGAGDMGNDGVHDIDYARWGLGVDRHPVRISALGGKFYYDDDAEFPDTQQVTFEYAPEPKDGERRLLIYEQRLWSTNYPHNVDSGAEFYGDKGQMFLSRRGKVEVRGESGAVVEISVEPLAQNDAAHVENFCESLRGHAKLNADARTGHLSTVLCHLGNIATRFGRTLTFDADKEQILEDEQANSLVSRQYRQHWATPGNV
jgi:predicted dehydrogenase